MTRDRYQQGHRGLRALAALSGVLIAGCGVLEAPAPSGGSTALTGAEAGSGASTTPIIWARYASNRPFTTTWAGRSGNEYPQYCQQNGDYGFLIADASGPTEFSGSEPVLYRDLPTCVAVIAAQKRVGWFGIEITGAEPSVDLYQVVYRPDGVDADLIDYCHPDSNQSGEWVGVGSVKYDTPTDCVGALHYLPTNAVVPRVETGADDQRTFDLQSHVITRKEAQALEGVTIKVEVYGTGRDAHAAIQILKPLDAPGHGHPPTIVVAKRSQKKPFSYAGKPYVVEVRVIEVTDDTVRKVGLYVENGDGYQWPLSTALRLDFYSE